MKNRIRILFLVMTMLIFSGCGGNKDAVSAEPPGILSAIEYGRRVDMVWGENFSVRVVPSEIVFIDYYVEEDRDYRFASGLPLEEGQWQQLESAVLELLPGLTEIKPKKETLWDRIFRKERPFLLDGADSATLSLDWKTEEGFQSASYNWSNDDPRMQQLTELLYALRSNDKGE